MILTERGAIVNTFFRTSKNIFKREALRGPTPALCTRGTEPEGRRDGYTGRSNRSPLVDSQEEPAAAYCCYCRGEIYEGEEYYCVDGQAVCTDCLDALARDQFRLCRVNGGT